MASASAHRHAIAGFAAAGVYPWSLCTSWHSRTPDLSKFWGSNREGLFTSLEGRGIQGRGMGPHVPGCTHSVPCAVWTACMHHCVCCFRGCARCMQPQGSVWCTSSLPCVAQLRSGGGGGRHCLRTVDKRRESVQQFFCCPGSLLAELRPHRGAPVTSLSLGLNSGFQAHHISRHTRVCCSIHPAQASSFEGVENSLPENEE